MFAIDSDNRELVITSPDGRVLKMGLRTYFPHKAPKPVMYEMYTILNDFLAESPVEVRTNLYECYNDTTQAFLANSQQRDKKLNEIFKRIFTVVEIERLGNYIRTALNLEIPKTVPDVFDPNETKFKKERTYDKDEYRELIPFIVCLRLCVPIWDTFMANLKHGGVSIAKEPYYAFLLLKGCSILDTPAYQRLWVYVNAQMVKSIDTNVTTLVGVGKSEIPEWLMSNVVVKKLPMTKLIGEFGDQPENAVATAHKAIRNQLTSPQSLLAGNDNFRQRQSIGRDTDDGQEQSFIETYRSRTPAFYDIELNIVYLMGDVGKICTDFDESFDTSISDAVVAVTDGVENIEFRDYHHILSLWILDRMLLTVAPDTVERVVTANSMRVAQSLLHSWGLHTLALLVTSDVDDTYDTSTGYSDRVTGLPDDLLAKLNEIYPFAKPMPNNRKAKPVDTNYGYAAISKLAATIIDKVYIVRVPAFLTSKDVAVDASGRMQLNKSILAELAKLLIKLDEI